MEKDEDFKIWKMTARNYQQSCSNSLGDRIYDQVNEEQLKQKVGFALYNLPSEFDEEKKIYYYTKPQEAHIKLMCEKIKSLHPTNDGFYYFSCIYIVFQLRNKKKDAGIQVLFRIPRFVDSILCPDSYVFLDPKPRKYDSWDIYLKKNKLPKCDMCYPKNGVYSETDGIVDLTFAPSNACDTKTAIFNGLDISSTILLIGATGVSLASLALPIATPVVWGATATVLASGSYDTARKVYSLHDLKKHGEGLGLKNPDARNAWLTLAGSVVGMASIGTTAVAKSVIATESAISRAGILTLRVLNISSLAVNGLGVLNGIITLIIKHINGTLEAKDVFEFIHICFFFLNAVITYSLASKLIDELASSDMKNLFNLRANSDFEFVKTVCSFDNMNLLLSLISGDEPKFCPDLKTDDLENMVLHVFINLMKLSSEKINLNQFCQETVSIISNIWKRYKDVILTVVSEIKHTYGIENWLSLLTKKSATNLETSRITCQEIDTVIKTCGVDHGSIDHKSFMTLARAFSINKTKTDHDIIRRLKLYCESIISQYREEHEKYTTYLDLKSSEGLSRDELDQNYGIKEKKEHFFFKKAINKVNDPDFLENIDLLYDSLQQTQSCDAQLPFLQTNYSKLFTFCTPFDEHQLEDSFYWGTASELTGFKVDVQNCTLKKKSDFVLIQPKPGHSINELEAIIIKTEIIDQLYMGFIILLLK